MKENQSIRVTVDVTGAVQGVGFRPAVFRLATRAGLGGSVQNRSGAVRLVLEGPPASVDAFLHKLPDALPHPIRVDQLRRVGPSVEIEHRSSAPFLIETSTEDAAPDIVIPADMACCDACTSEVFNPAERRYGYAFATCTACGPRYTIVNAMPYDRARTTMNAFPMCPRCAEEYADPQNRRFHAETIACPDCGPQLSLLGADGNPTPGKPLQTARAMLLHGNILAVRGIGGFLLAADAFNAETLTRLRDRKNRPHKPFAVMARNLEVVRRYCNVTDESASLLSSRERPIVILDVRPDTTLNVPTDLLTPDAATLGVMLPTSPLHELLMRPFADDPTPPFDLLVMTSGNRRGEPICIANEEATLRLSGIADAFLCHDREINLRNDDSLFATQSFGPQVWRRARGHAPEPIALPRPVRRTVLAMGAELKNTVTLAYDDRAVLSPHIGDLETPEANDGFEQVVTCLPAFLERKPEAIAVDMHPDMHSTRTGNSLARKLDVPLVTVQHHHAHGAACLAENALEQGLALVLDGTGLGPDGTIWGAELLWIDGDGFRRLATFSPVPLPGGHAAVVQPRRQLAGRWSESNPDSERLASLGIDGNEWRIWHSQCRQGLNAPMTHAAGRLFDACAAALGISPQRVTYEGQAPVRLEAEARRAPESADSEALSFIPREEQRLLTIDWAPTFNALADCAPAPRDVPAFAMAFHHAVARACVTMIRYGFDQVALDVPAVALSGGVFMNRILTQLVVAELDRLRARALVHRRTPPNDGCISLGQAVIAGGM
jgi:hydrogenase maturation protein HypF